MVTYLVFLNHFLLLLFSSYIEIPTSQFLEYQYSIYRFVSETLETLVDNYLWLKLHQQLEIQCCVIMTLIKASSVIHPKKHSSTMQEIEIVAQSFEMRIVYDRPMTHQTFFKSSVRAKLHHLSTYVTALFRCKDRLIQSPSYMLYQSGR